MWVLFTRRLRLWLLASIALPVAGWLLGRAGETLERRRGSSGVSRALIGAGDKVRRRRR